MLSRLFSPKAQDRLERRIAKKPPAWKERPDAVAAQAFSPTRPQFSGRGFVGREKELARIMRALRQEHAHVALFGERGRGKSSLANCAVEQLQRLDGIVARASCNPQTSFDMLVRNLLRSLPASLAADLPPEPAEGCESLLPQRPLTPLDVVGLPGLFGGRPLTLVIEEFDRLTDPVARSLVIDTSKQLSDRGASVSFLIVGVADSVDELIGANPSIYRSVVPVELPLLGTEAVQAIVDGGLRSCGMGAPAEVRNTIVRLARGAPYMAHLLGLRTAQAAADGVRRDLSMTDVATAARQIVRESDPAIASLLAGLAGFDGSEALSRLLLQISDGQRDQFGRFHVEPAGPDETYVAGEVIRAHDWSRLLSAALFRPVGEPALQTFSFASSYLEHYALLKAIR